MVGVALPLLSPGMHDCVADGCLASECLASGHILGFFTQVIPELPALALQGKAYLDEEGAVEGLALGASSHEEI
jgi:hypothetical protein